MASASTTDNTESRETPPAEQRSEAGSRIPNFFRMSIAQRVDALHRRGLSSDDDMSLLEAAGYKPPNLSPGG